MTEHAFDSAAHPRLFAQDALAGSTALITGGGTGIGAAVARQLSDCGAAVVLLGRRAEPLTQVAEEIRGRGGEVLPISTDIRDAEQVDHALAEIRSALGRIDILVNNAGGQFVAAAKDTSTRGLEAVARLNVNGTWTVTRAVALDSMIGRGGGRVINITLAMERGIPGMMAGVASRAAVHSMTRTLGTEWARHGISVVSVAAGHILTDGLRGYPPEIVARLESSIPAGRFGSPEEVAATVAFLASPYAAYLTGTTVVIDGGKSNAGDTYMVDPDAT
jgi:citronellol/citronellal dehydrogenase